MTANARVALLDAFTAEAYRGNPAAVVLSVEPLDGITRRNLAIEFNQPAIAFVSHPAIHSADEFAQSSESPLIRWHTSTGASLPLCGHATMAASSYLLDYFVPTRPAITYRFLLPNIHSNGVVSETSHELVAARTEDGRIEIALPASLKSLPVTEQSRVAILDALRAASGVEAIDVEDICASESNEPNSYNLTIRLSPRIDLGALKIDSPAFLSVPYRGIYLTNLYPTSSTSTSHFRSRVFFPSVGILEDHVCGSAHTRLGPYWIEHFSQTESPLPEVVEVDQVSPRGGQFALRWDGKWGEEGGIVALRGRAKLIMEGELRI